MNQYQEFSKELIGRYMSAEEESNELYKKRHIHFESEELLGLATAKPSIQDDETALSIFYKSNFSGSGLSFDAIIGSSGFIALKESASAIRFVDSKDLPPATAAGMPANADDKYDLLMSACARRNIIIEVPEGEEKSISMLFAAINEPAVFNIIVKAGSNSSLNILEWHASKGGKPLLSASSHSIALDEYSSCEINVIHNEGESTKVLSLYDAKAMPNASLKVNSFYSGGSATKARGTVDAQGHASNVEVNEFVFGTAEQKLDINTNIINSSSNTNARLATRAAAMDGSICYLKGFSKILNGARDSKSFVEEAGILLGKSARIDSIPAMSIDEDRVKATHSSAIGPIDEESIFYMNTHGIDYAKAKELLVNGFFSSHLGNVGNSQAKAAFAAIIRAKMRGSGIGTTPKLENSGMWFSEPSDDMLKRHYKYRSEKDED